MHAPWGPQQLGFSFELKGGASLSKGLGLIHRLSEEIDIRIAPQIGVHTSARAAVRAPTYSLDFSTAGLHTDFSKRMKMHMNPSSPASE